MLFGVWSMIHRCATSLRFTTFGGAPAKAIDAFEQNRMLGRGVNIIGYDRIWREREHAQFQAKHFTLLKEAGFELCPGQSHRSTIWTAPPTAGPFAQAGLRSWIGR